MGLAMPPARTSLPCQLLIFALLSGPCARAATTPFEGIVGVVPVADGEALEKPVLDIEVHNLTSHRVTVTSARAGSGVAAFKVSKKTIAPDSDARLAEIRFATEQMPYWARHHTTGQHALDDSEKPRDGGIRLLSNSKFNVDMDIVEPSGANIPVDVTGGEQWYSTYRLAQYVTAADGAGLAGIFAYLHYTGKAFKRARAQLLEEGLINKRTYIKNVGNSNIAPAEKAERIRNIYTTMSPKDLFEEMGQADQQAVLGILREHYKQDLLRELESKEAAIMATPERRINTLAWLQRKTDNAMLSYGVKNPARFEAAIEKILSEQGPANQTPEDAALRTLARDRLLFAQKLHAVTEPEIQGSMARFRRAILLGRIRGVVGGVLSAAGVAALAYGLFEIGHVIATVYGNRGDTTRVPAQSNQTVNLELGLPAAQSLHQGFGEVNNALGTARTVRGKHHAYLVTMLLRDSRYFDFYSHPRGASAPADEKPEAAGQVGIYIARLPTAAQTCDDLKMVAQHGHEVMQGRCKNPKGGYQETSLYLDACVPLADVTNDHGRLACQEAAPPGSYRTYFQPAYAVAGPADTYAYDPWSGVLSVSALGVDRGHPVTLRLDYRDECKSGSSVQYDPWSRKLYCTQKRLNITGSALHYCKGYAVDAAKHIALQDCRRDGGPQMNLRFDLSRCPDPDHMVLNLLPMQKPDSKIPPWRSPTLVMSQSMHGDYGVECVDLWAPDRAAEFVPPRISNPFDRAIGSHRP